MKLSISDFSHEVVPELCALPEYDENLNMKCKYNEDLELTECFVWCTNSFVGEEMRKYIKMTCLFNQWLAELNYNDGYLMLPFDIKTLSCFKYASEYNEYNYILLIYIFYVYNLCSQYSNLKN
ncbi:hypothetical protein MHBO_001895 [Bonamia ostreae]|uniref:Uncharacterized protein n=1 Tax=Bonamia ostreae TaxID=126728 RepID=A0ABV2AKI2_9EUKA